MGFRINTNIAAMNAHTNATINNRHLDNSLSKLSSGLRINKAADDASGMVIANSLRAQASSLAQAVMNGNDAIGLIQTADGALDEYSKILETIKTKSIQAASDGQNTTSRLAIQKDIDRLMEELNVIARTTSFNGQKLLSGTFVNKEFQMGANANESIKASIASTETSQIGQTSRAKLEIATLGENQLTLRSATTGKTLSLEKIDLQYNNQPINGMGAVADQINRYSGETGITAKAVVSSMTGDIKAGITGADFSINGITIGAINVSANDSEGTLLNAINSKTTQTGVSAIKTEDGKIKLSSNDGRAISVTGDLSNVTDTTGDDLSTMGYLEVVQVGSSTFAIEGAPMAAAAGGDLKLSGSMVTIFDSELSVGSTIKSSSTLAAGTKLGAVTTATESFIANSSSKDSLLTVGSIIASGSKINDGSELASKVQNTTAAALSSDMFVKAGSTLGSGTVFDAGTVLNQDITVAGVTYKAGTVLTVDLTLTSTVTLSKDMTMSVDLQAPNATLGSGSTLMAGTVVGADITTTGNSTLASDMVLKAGSILVTGSEMAIGSQMGDNVLVSGDHTTTAVTYLKTGSILTSGSMLKENSTVGGNIELSSAVTFNQDMLVKTGSVLATGTVLKAGTVLMQDLTDAQVGGGVGSGLKAGTVIGTDITVTDRIYVLKDMTLLKGEGPTYGSIAAGSELAPNAGNQNSVSLSDEEFTNLSQIDVTTLEGAMKAIDTVTAAIGNLDTIRSDLGSVQNQLVATINNISTTQVNVKAAESQLRDVDFAAESANFSKHNILAQSGSYAMSQANAVQQNVLKLLQ